MLATGRKAICFCDAKRYWAGASIFTYLMVSIMKMCVLVLDFGFACEVCLVLAC